MSTHLTIITGANRGIGLETARQLLLHHNHSLLLTSRTPQNAQKALTTLHPTSPHQTVTSSTLDVSSPDGIEAFLKGDLQTAISQSPPKQYITLINNAGIYQRPWSETFATNTRGPILLSQGFMSLLAQHKRQGRIINLTSGLGNAGNISRQTIQKLKDKFPTIDDILNWEPGSESPYSLSKHLVNYVSEIYAREGEAVGVEVCAVDPGWVQTDMGGAGAPRTIEEGGRTIATLAAKSPGSGVSGKVFSSSLKEVSWKGY
ncbi:hypothetical protein HDV00_008702 [Rhizophlyctis rosea]|nr:hypothetical protein HDV00_008702 [Rhizophlyctis rosea]